MGVRIAIVGCGAVAEMGYIPAARQVKEAQLVALVDSDRLRAEELAKNFEVPNVFGTIEDAASHIDAVILATPPHVRPRLAEQAFARGLHVLCEKPLANTSAECRTILTAARDAKRTVGVAHTGRFFPNRVGIFSLLQQKVLGTVSTVNVEQGSSYDWPTRTGYTVRADLVPGGVLLNEGLHSVDTLSWWFGQPLSFEYEDDAIGGVESNARLSIRFPNGVLGKVRLSRTCKLTNQIVIEGDAGKLLVPLYDQSQVFLTRNGATETQQFSTSEFDFVELVAEQLHDFVSSIVSDRPPRVPGTEGLFVVDFIERCYAAKRQRPLPERAPIPGMTW